jgi:hypothetical protein
MGLAERLKAIETSQSPVNTQVQQQVTNVPAHQPPTNIPPTNVP